MASKQLKFCYFDGIKSRDIDPLSVITFLSNCEFYRPAMIDSAIGGDGPSIMVLSEIVGQAFGVRFIDQSGNGLTRLDCIQLIERFDQFIRRLRQQS